MSPPSLSALAAHLCQSPLLTPGQRGELEHLQTRFPDPKALAQQLLQRGWLTPYQLNQLFVGRGGDLVLGSYVILERLGEGGTGQVFKARHLHMDRVVALKVIRKEVLADPDAVARFRREIHAVSQLDHPHVVHAYDAGPVGANFYLAMEYVEGIDLQRLVKGGGPLTVVQACAHASQAAAGLQYIHEKGLVHRDIKPSNLLGRGLADAAGRSQQATPGGTIKILDLGLARLRRPLDHALTGGLTATSSVMMGTLDYMAPEQALDFHTADIRADVYSLGCSFYFLLTGRAPFEGGTPAQLLLAHQQKEAPPVAQVRRDVPAEVATVLGRMMAKEPAARYQTPGEVVQALAGPAGTLPVPIPLGQPGSRALVATVPRLAPLAIVIDGNRGLVRAPVWRRWRLSSVRRLRWRRVAAFAGALFMAILLGWLILGPARPPDITYLSHLREERNAGDWFDKNGAFKDGAAAARVIVGGVPISRSLYMGVTDDTRRPAIVSYRLDKQYRSFHTKVALNDSTRGDGVIFTVIADGDVKWRSQPIGPAGVQECTLSMTNVSVLELLVVRSKTGWTEQIMAVWLDPYLVK